MNPLAGFSFGESIYFLINLSGAFFYFAILTFIIKLICVRKGTRTRFTFAFGVLAFCLTAYFLLNLRGVEALLPRPIQILMPLAMIIPGIVLLSCRDQVILVASPSELEAKMERFHQLKNEFLTVASHELRTPLSVINGFAEILVREKLGTLNDEQKRRVRKILMQGQRLNRIIDELLDLNRIRSGKVEMRKMVFDLVPVLKACYDDHVVICEQQNIRFEDKIPDVLPDVNADLDRTTQVIVNLLNNAIKYTPSGGKVTLEAIHEKNDPFLKVVVTDTGIGIDLTEQTFVFNEFYRSSQSVSRKYAGSGLGLAIVKQLVESQGGTVSLSSEGLGKGCVFTFTLPLAPRNALCAA